MIGILDINKKIARHIASKFDGFPKVTRYWSSDQAISVVGIVLFLINLTEHS